MTGVMQSWRKYFQAGCLLSVAAMLLALGPLSKGALAQLPGQEDSPEDVPAAKGDKKPAAEVVPPPPGMTFTTRLDKTAVWVADQFHYFITVDYVPEYEFVLDNLNKETVNMDPFQVIDVNKKVTILKNNNRQLLVDLELANFSTGQTSLQIPQFTLYYFRKDHRNAGPEQAAAESLTVPGPLLGLRSTLPPEPADIRDTMAVVSWDRARYALPVAGIVCCVLLVAGTGWELALFVRNRKARKGPDRRKAMEAVRARWASAVPADFSDPGATMDFYTHSYHDVKEYLGFYLESPTEGLTAEELTEEMQRLGANAELTQKVSTVVTACETVRYARNGTAPDSDAARRIAQDVREILSQRPS